MPAMTRLLFSAFFIGVCLFLTVNLTQPASFHSVAGYKAPTLQASSESRSKARLKRLSPEEKYQTSLKKKAEWERLPKRPRLSSGPLAAPANDNCASAEIIPGTGPFPYTTSIISVVEATSDPSDPAITCGGDPMHSVWYSFTPQSDGVFTFSACGTASDFDSIFGLYTSTGGCGTAFTQVACNDDSCGLQSQVSAALQTGVTYSLVVYSFGEVSPGSNTLQVRVLPPAEPATNDECSTATVIPGAGPFPYASAPVGVSAASMSPTDPDPSCTVEETLPNIWYTFTPAVSGNYLISACGGETLTSTGNAISFFTSTGGCAGPFTEAVCFNNDNCGSQQESGTVPLTGGTTYFILVELEGTLAPDSVVQLLVDLLIPPANDTCAGAIPLTLNIPENGTTEFANGDYELDFSATCLQGDGNQPDVAAGPDVVYSFTAPATGTYSVRLETELFEEAQLDPVLYVSDACGPASPQTINCLAAANRPTGSPFFLENEEIRCLTLNQNQTIYIYVDDANSQSTPFGFTVVVTPCNGEVEPNDDPETPSLVSCNTQGGFSGQDSIDYFSAGMNTVDGSRLFAVVDASTMTGSDLDMRVIQGNDTLEYDDDDNAVELGDQSPNVAGTPLGTGDVLLQVTNPGGGSGPYRIVAVVQPPASQAEAEVEGNNTVVTANALPSGYIQGTVSGFNDVDVFSFTASAGDLYFISLDTDPSRENAPFSGQLELLTSTNGVLRRANDATPTSSTTSGAGSLSSTTPFSPGEAILYQFQTTGTYYVRVSEGSEGSGGDYLLSIARPGIVAPEIEAPQLICSGQTGLTASVPMINGATYNWSITNGTITAGQNTTEITFTPATSGTVGLSVTVTTGGCSATATLDIPIQGGSVSITAPASVCAGSTGNTASVSDFGQAVYEWTITNGTITSGDGTTSIQFTAGTSGSVTLDVTVIVGDCQFPASQTIPITTVDATITAPSAVCSGSTGNTASVPNAGQGATYTWGITNGTITGGQNTPALTFTAGSTSPVGLSVTVTVGQCSATGTASVTILQTPATPSIQFGTTTVCSGQSATASTATVEGRSYLWTVTNGTLTDGQGTSGITFTAGTSGQVQVTLIITDSGCSSPQASASLPIAEFPSATITVPGAVCPDATGNTASVPDAGAQASYVWNITNGTITSGLGTQTIIFSAGSSGTVGLTIQVTNAAGCVTNGLATIAISAVPVATITTPEAVCAGSSGNQASISGTVSGDIITWNVTNGTITSGAGTSQIAYTAGPSGVVGLSVTINRSGCTSNGSASVQINPLTNISDQPDPLTLNVGETATFMISATGTSPLTIQWFYDADCSGSGTPVALTNGGRDGRITISTTEGGSTLSIASVVPGDGGCYLATVTGPCGVVTSTPAQLVIRATELALLWVADTFNNRIQKYDGISWTVLGSGVPGSSLNDFRNPEAVTASIDGQRVYVADTLNDRIQYSTDGGLTWNTLAEQGTSVNQVKGPQGVTYDVQGNLYVADTANNRVLRFNGGVPGNAVVLASYGTQPGQVRSPMGLGIDANFNLYIADKLNSRVLRIASANTVSTVNTGITIAATGSRLNPGEVRLPEAVAVDNAGNLYVADTGNNRILLFQGGNRGVAIQVCRVGTLLGQVRGPEGLTVTSFLQGQFAGGSTLVISDTLNQRIQARRLPTGNWVTLGLSTQGSQLGQFNYPGRIR